MARPDTKTERVMGMIAPKETPEGGGAVPVPAGARDIQAITADILTAKQEAGNAILRIGRGLIEAKKLLSHGEWLPWLEREVDFSEATAERYMKIAREWTNPAALQNLGFSKALKLLSLPEAAREEFIAVPHTVKGEEKTVDEMSVRELEQAIRERDEARRELEAEKAAVQEWRTKANDFELAKDEAETAASITEKDNAELREKVRELETKPTDVAVETKVIRDEDAVREAVAAAREEERKKREAVEVDRDGRQAEAEEQRARADALAREVETLKKAQEDAAKAADKITTTDRAAAEILIAQTAANLEKLAAILKSAGEAEDAELTAALRGKFAAWARILGGLGNET